MCDVYAHVYGYIISSVIMNCHYHYLQCDIDYIRMTCVLRALIYVQMYPRRVSVDMPGYINAYHIYMCVLGALELFCM